MSFPGVFKLGRVSIILTIWHLAIMDLMLPVYVGVVEILVLTSICLGWTVVYMRMELCC